MPSKTLISFLFLISFSIFGMKRTDTVKYENIMYQDWHSSQYLDQIFAPMFKKGGKYEFCDTLLDHAKKNRYCPETTMLFLQSVKAYISTALPRELLFIIFDYAVVNSSFFYSNYKVDKKIFKSPECIKLNDCTVSIQKLGFKEEKLYMTVTTDKKCSSKELSEHAIQVRDQFVNCNNFPVQHPAHFECSVDGGNSYNLSLSIPQKGFIPLSVNPWFYKNGDNYFFDNFHWGRPPDIISVYKPDGSLINIPSSAFGIDGLMIRSVHVFNVLKNMYIIFQMDINRSTYLESPIQDICPKIKIYEINTSTFAPTLVQTILMPVELKKVYSGDWSLVETRLYYNTEFLNGVIYIPCRSLLFFKSIFPVTNYSLIDKAKTGQWLLQLRDQETVKLQKKEEKRDKEALKSSPEYLDAMDELKSFYQIDIRSKQVLCLSGLLLIVGGCCHLLCFWNDLTDDYSIFGTFYSWMISIFFASLSISRLELYRQKNLEKRFPGILETAGYIEHSFVAQ